MLGEAASTRKLAFLEGYVTAARSTLDLEISSRTNLLLPRQS